MKSMSRGSEGIVASVVETPVSAQQESKLHHRILVAEDARCIQMFMGSLLRKMDLEVDMAEDGEVACKKAIQSQTSGNPYDVIFMDIQMPKMNGRQAVKWLREHEWKGPIIAVSIHTTERDHAEFFRMGCNGYISKPVREDVLREVLAEHLHHAECPMVS